MSLRERQRALIRGEIQRAAFTLFARDGFDAVTTDQIAAEAGISPSTYFRHVSGVRRTCSWIRSARVVPTLWRYSKSGRSTNGRMSLFRNQSWIAPTRSIRRRLNSGARRSARPRTCSTGSR